MGTTLGFDSRLFKIQTLSLDLVEIIREILVNSKLKSLNKGMLDNRIPIITFIEGEYENVNLTLKCDRENHMNIVAIIEIHNPIASCVFNVDLTELEEQIPEEILSYLKG